MKLYDSVGPNPRVVRAFMSEKGIVIPTEKVDVRGGENRQVPHLKRNPHGQTPTLELDNGSYISEITAICEYLEDKQPQPPLIGITPEEKAECRMWTRRVDLNICEPLTNGYRYGEGKDFFKNRLVTVPEGAAGLKAVAQNRLGWLEGQIDGKTFICGSRFTLADILLFCFLDFGVKFGQSLNPDNKNILAWFERVGARPSVHA